MGYITSRYLYSILRKCEQTLKKLKAWTCYRKIIFYRKNLYKHVLKFDTTCNNNICTHLNFIPFDILILIHTYNLYTHRKIIYSRDWNKLHTQINRRTAFQDHQLRWCWYLLQECIEPQNPTRRRVLHALSESGYKVLGYSKLSLGGVAGCVIDPKVVFQTALKANASSIILAHNHPSSNLNPSVADLRITTKLIEGGKLLDIKILDHVILSATGYYSLAEKGCVEF